MLNWPTFAARYTNPQPLYGMRPALMPHSPRYDRTKPADLYRVLRAYYWSNGLYDALADLLRRQGVWREEMKALRNPAYRVVEFHAAHLWPGTLPNALPIMADRKSIVKPIQQVWKWSNFGSTKQVLARDLALYGDFFIKVATTPPNDPQRVYFQRLEPEHVTEFDHDERDFITYARLDIPQTRRLTNGQTETYTHTEEWNQDTGRYRVWEHDYGVETAIDHLGQATIDEDIASFGIDFVPISHAKFADIGEPRGMGALVPALDKIDEANRSATRLHRQIWRHNNVLWALNGGVDASGRPMPAPRINATDPTTDSSDDGTVTFGDEQMLALPGNSELKSLVPNLNYEAALRVLQDHMDELKSDLPELMAYDMKEKSNLSGRAVRLMLGPAVARVEEARGNGESAIARADQMALTMGKTYGLFRNVGTFEKGDFEHAFEPRDVLPSDELERAQAQQADGAALASYVGAGMSIEMAVQELWGWSAERAAQFTTENLAAIQREQVLAQNDMPPDAVGVVQ